MSNVFVQPIGSISDISLDCVNCSKDISDQIDEITNKREFEVGENFRNLRVLYNGRDQTCQIESTDPVNFRFTLKFIPRNGETKELLIYYDKP
jgi:hypothetical protein